MPQPGGGCLPCHSRPKNPRAGCVSVEQIRQAVFAHALHVFLTLPGMRQSEFHHGSLQELCWLQDASSTSDLGGKVGRFMLQIFNNLCCFLLKAIIRIVWWTSERALTKFLGHESCALCYFCVTRNATLNPSPPCPPHGSEGASFCVWGLGAFRTCGNGVDEPFTVGEFTLIRFSSHKQSLLCCCWNEAWGPSQAAVTHNTHSLQICLTNHFNHIVLFQEESKQTFYWKRSPKPCFPLAAQAV